MKPLRVPHHFRRYHPFPLCTHPAPTEQPSAGRTAPAAVWL